MHGMHHVTLEILWVFVGKCIYLHLGPLVLEPEFNLPWVQIELSAELKPSFLIGMRTLLE